jgi:hypothetical protein
MTWMPSPHFPTHVRRFWLEPRSLFFALVRNLRDQCPSLIDPDAADFSYLPNASFHGTVRWTHGGALSVALDAATPAIAMAFARGANVAIAKASIGKENVTVQPVRDMAAFCRGMLELEEVPLDSRLLMLADVPPADLDLFDENPVWEHRSRVMAKLVTWLVVLHEVGHVVSRQAYFRQQQVSGPEDDIIFDFLADRLAATWFIQMSLWPEAIDEWGIREAVPPESHRACVMELAFITVSLFALTVARMHPSARDGNPTHAPIGVRMLGMLCASIEALEARGLHKEANHARNAIALPAMIWRVSGLLGEENRNGGMLPSWSETSARYAEVSERCNRWIGMITDWMPIR